MLDLKISKCPGLNYDSMRLIMQEGNIEFKNICCTEEMTQMLLDKFKDSLPNTDWIFVTIKTEIDNEKDKA